MTLLTIFGGAALLLAAIGIYGLMAYSVQQRTQEIGIRLALGAAPGSVRNTSSSQGMRLALAGVVIGVAAAFGLTRLLASFLFGVKAWDPLVFISVPVLLSAVALLAVWHSGDARHPHRSGGRPPHRMKMWRTHSCVPRRHSCRRLLSS